MKEHPRNFRDKDGNLFMIYCPECRRENWAMAVASGQCAWCGWKEEADPAERSKLTIPHKTTSEPKDFTE